MDKLSPLSSAPKKSIRFLDRTVHGRVSSRCLAAELGVEDPRTNYTAGDVVAARVVQCDRRRNRSGDGEYFFQLRLSLKTSVEERPEPTAEEKADGAARDAREGAVPIAAGSVLAARRMKVLQLVNCARRDDGSPTYPGYAVVAVKSKFLAGSRGGGGDAVEFKLPFDQLRDAYGADLGGPEELDGIAAETLTVGKRIDAEGLILSVPVGSDRLPVVTLRPALVETVASAAAAASSSSAGDLTIACPSPRSNLFMGEYVRGYVTRVDPRYGAFVRFLDGLSGLIPKLKKGLNESLYDTILCKVTALDITSSPPKILLKRVTEGEVAKKREAKKSKEVKRQEKKKRQPRVGDVVDEVKVVDVNFARAKVRHTRHFMFPCRIENPSFLTNNRGNEFRSTCSTRSTTSGPASTSRWPALWPRRSCRRRRDRRGRSTRSPSPIPSGGGR